MTPVPYLEGAWVNNFRNGLHTRQGSMEVANEWIKPRQHKNDAHLIQALMESDQVAMNKLCSLL
eukprot:887412-Ditylum_brightwellii.AAC.1